MSEKLFVGIGRVSLFFRQARNLKDKRSVLQSLKQKLRNEGFSVVEVGHQEEVKKGFLGFSFAANNLSQLDAAFDKAADFLLGNFEVVNKSKKVVELECNSEFDDSQLTRSLLGDIDD